MIQKSKLKSALITSLMFACLFCFTACKKNPEEKAVWITNRIAHYLDLDSVQRAKLDEIAQEILAVRSENQAERLRMRAALAVELRSDQLDLDRLRSLAQENLKIRKQKLLPRIAPKIVDFHKILRPEQKDKMARAIEVQP